MASILIMSHAYKNSNKKQKLKNNDTIKNMEKNEVVDSITLHDTMKKNTMLKINQVVSLINLYNKILLESNYKKASNKLYKDEFIISNKNEYIQLHKIGSYKGDIYTFIIDEKLCIIFEHSLDTMKHIMGSIQHFNNLNNSVMLRCVRLCNKRYKKYCNDIYYITYIDTIEF